MIRKTIVLLVMPVLLLPGLATAVTERDFEAYTARQTVSLYTVSSEDPFYHRATNPCPGYFEGAYQNYEAMPPCPKGITFVCVRPPPSRNDAIGWFIEWTEANLQYMDEGSVELQFRFLMEKWPCK
jgi:hypothetical protein